MFLMLYSTEPSLYQGQESVEDVCAGMVVK